MENVELLRKIIGIQTKSARLIKPIGLLLLNPFSIGILTYLAVDKIGGSFWWVWLPTYVVMGIIYFIIANLLIGMPTQLRSIKLYSMMTDSDEKIEAMNIIKSTK